MSNKKEREKRREERLQAETSVSAEDKRKRLLQLGAGAIFIVVIAVVVLIVVNGSSSSSGGDAANVKEVTQVDKLVSSAPQEALTIGKSSAPVELFEYGDLQCPVCKAFSEEVLPQVIEKQVKEGKAKITFRNFTIIGEESIPAGAAAIAAGAQGRGWNYLELFYRNQGEERSGYVTDAFMESIAKGAGVKDLNKWNEEREDPKTTAEVNKTTEQAQTFGFTGTPSFAIKGPKSNGIELLGTPSSADELEAEIEKVS
jgi:protein-disulfide isomerase